ncbi:MAG: DUF2849 domain-containing protein [Alkalilacustris sp.]
MTAQIIRAFDPLDGETIYLAATGGWTRDPQAAARAASPAEARALLAVAEMQPDSAEAPELAPAPALRRRAPEAPGRGPVSRPAAAGAWQAAEA